MYNVLAAQSDCWTALLLHVPDNYHCESAVRHITAAGIGESVSGKARASWYWASV